jgi:vacuolar-type H+-ATPase subunit D/Vma8
MGNSPSQLSDREINSERNKLRKLYKYKNRFGEVFTPMNLKTRRHFLSKFYEMEQNLSGYEHDEIMKIYLKVEKQIELDEKEEKLTQMKIEVEETQRRIEMIRHHMDIQRREEEDRKRPIIPPK